MVAQGAANVGFYHAARTSMAGVLAVDTDKTKPAPSG